MPHLVATVFAMLMLVLTAFAGPGCQSSQAKGDETTAMLSIAPVAVQAAESLCRAPATVDAELASAAIDKQADTEDRVEMMAVEIPALGKLVPSAFQGPQLAAGVPAPWLPGLLRPPRTQHA